MQHNLIISYAHEVVQALPLSKKLYCCMRCTMRGSLKELFGSIRCTPHYELATSGWKDEKNS